MKISFYLYTSLCMYKRTTSVITPVLCTPNNYLKTPAVPKLFQSKDLLSELHREISDFQDFIIFMKQATDIAFTDMQESFLIDC